MSSAEAGSVRDRLAEIVIDSRGGSRGISLADRIRYSLAIRRIEFSPGHILIGLVPAALGARGWGELLSLNALVGVLFAITNMQLADMINALADREEDAAHKSRVSTAVYGLGVRRVVTQIAATSALYVGMAVFLAARTQHWDLLLIVLIGWLVCAEYSLPPLHLKSAGIGQMLGLHVWVLVPGLFVLRSFDHALSWNDVAAVVGLPLVLVASFVTNQVEDYFDDEKFGIKTYVRAMGLTTALTVQSVFVLVGALLIIGSVYADSGFVWGMIPFIGAWLVLQWFLLTLIRDVRGPIEAAISKVRGKANTAPYLGMLVSASTVVMGLSVFMGQ